MITQFQIKTCFSHRKFIYSERLTWHFIRKCQIKIIVLVFLYNHPDNSYTYIFFYLIF